MEYQEFIENLLRKVKDKVGDHVSAEVISVQKANGTKKEAISFKDKEKDPQPILYTEQIYQQFCQGWTLEACAGYAAEIYRRAQESEVARNLWEWKFIKDKIELCILKEDWNRDFLQGVPYKKYLDLAIYCRVVLEREERQVASATVNASMLQAWHVTEEILWETAFSNFRGKKFRINTMETLFPQITGNGGGSLPAECFVITDKDYVYGAAAILRTDLLEGLSDLLGCSFYILPSSLHEIILLADQEEKDTETLREMVREINRKLVGKEEWLSDQIYYYRYKSGKVEVCA